MMIVVMNVDATTKQVSDVVARIKSLGYDIHISEGAERTIVGVVGRGVGVDREKLGSMTMMEGVAQIIPVSHPYKLASNEFHPEPTTIPLNGTLVGSAKIAIIAGPCSVEDRVQILETAH